MFCAKCGEQLEDGLKFCTNCGASVEGAAEGAPSPAVPVVPVVSQTFPAVSQPAAVPTQQNAQSGWNAPQGLPANPPQKKSKTPLIIAIVAAVVVVAVALTYFLMIKPGQDEAQRAADEASKGIDIIFTCSGEGYVASASTPIAISVQGSTSNGKNFNETYFVKGSESIKIPYGTYTAKPLGSPLCSDGAVFRFEPTSVRFTVSSTGATDAPNFKMHKINAIDVTDEQISAAVKGAELADVSSNEISTLRQKIVDARKAATDAAKASQNKVYMTVVNCEEWISLRVSPSTSADRIVKIPLGEKVEYLGESRNGFAKVSWNGMTGWSLLSYLR